MMNKNTLIWSSVGVLGALAIGFLARSRSNNSAEFITQSIVGGNNDGSYTIGKEGTITTTNDAGTTTTNGGGDVGGGGEGEMLSPCDSTVLNKFNSANIKINVDKSIDVYPYGNYDLSCNNLKGWTMIEDDPSTNKGIFSGARWVNTKFTIDPWTKSIICSNSKGEQCIFTVKHKDAAKCGEVTPQPLLEGQQGGVLCRNMAKDCMDKISPIGITISPNSTIFPVKRSTMIPSGTESRINFSATNGTSYIATCSRTCGFDQKRCDIPFAVTKPTCSAKLTSTGAYTIQKTNEGVNKLFCNLYKDGKVIKYNVSDTGSLATPTEPGVYSIKCHKGSTGAQEITCMSSDIIMPGTQCPYSMTVTHTNTTTTTKNTTPMYNSIKLDYKYIEDIDFPSTFPRNTIRRPLISCKLGDTKGTVTVAPQTNPLDYKTIYHYTCKYGSTVCHGFAQYPKKDIKGTPDKDILPQT